MIACLHHVQITIPKGAESDARRFYCDLLGMHEVEKPASLAGRGGFWLEIQGMQVHIGTEDGVDRAASKAHVAYLVDDLENARRMLVENGVVIIEGVPIPNYRRFEFRDPFGNRVEFLEKEP
jgi:catechol 2,3-dioxygenase-like lactoylglutathione lyase family enzyme